MNYVQGKIEQKRGKNGVNCSGEFLRRLFFLNRSELVEASGFQVGFRFMFDLLADTALAHPAGQLSVTHATSHQIKREVTLFWVTSEPSLQVGQHDESCMIMEQESSILQHEKFGCSKDNPSQTKRQSAYVENGLQASSSSTSSSEIKQKPFE